MRTSRLARLITTVSAGVLVAGLASVPAEAASIAIISFGASPAQVPSTGGTVTFHARTGGAKTCSLTSSARIAGLPAKIACSSGRAVRKVTVPGLNSRTDTSITFTFTARNGSLATHASLTVVRLATAPTITAVRTAVLTGSAGDSLHIRATVRHARNCTLSSTPAIKGLPATTPCARGTYFRAVRIAKNTTTTAKRYTLRLTATSASGATRTVTVRAVQAAGS